MNNIPLEQQLEAILAYEASLQGGLGINPNQFKKTLRYNSRNNFWESNHPKLSDWFWEVYRNPQTGAIEVMAGD